MTKVTKFGRTTKQPNRFSYFVETPKKNHSFQRKRNDKFPKFNRANEGKLPQETVDIAFIGYQDKSQKVIDKIVKEYREYLDENFPIETEETVTAPRQ